MAPNVFLLVVTLIQTSVAAPSATPAKRQNDATAHAARCVKAEALEHGAQQFHPGALPRCHSHLQVHSGTKRIPRTDDSVVVELPFLPPHKGLSPARFGRKQSQSVRTGMLAGDAEPDLSGAGMVLVVRSILSEVAAQDFDPFMELVPGSFPHIWGHDMFPERRHAHPQDGDEGLNFFSAAPLRDWVTLGVVSFALCLFDVLVLQRMPQTVRVHVGSIVLWLMVALLFNMWIWSRMGQQKAMEWCAGYVLEWMLSMDNLFVFHLIFQTYKTPSQQVHKAVFVGVIGAIVMRMLFFMVVSTLLHLFHWIRIPFGLLLIWSGVEAAKGADDDVDVKDTALIRGLKWCLGSWLREEYDEDGCALFIWHDGRYQATLLFIVVACLEFTDIVFALDSVSAKVAQIPDQYIAFSSSVIAMFGLRAMFFVMQDMVEMFDLLQYGLCIILVFIGAELMFSQYIHLAASAVCVLILSVFSICIAGSLAKKHLEKEGNDASTTVDS